MKNLTEPMSKIKKNGSKRPTFYLNIKSGSNKFEPDFF